MKIAFFNPQGNFDKKDSHLTEHPDFGGQLIYVKELAKAMGKMGNKVDIITRKIIDKKWPEFSGDFDYYPDAENVRIVRIAFGGDKFLNKERLWDFLGEYVKNIYRFYQKEGFPDFVTTHYGDGGIAGAMFKKLTHIPYSFTAHSLGAQKKDKFKNAKDAEERYRFSIRISAEKVAMKYASFIVTSTQQEKEEQYSHNEYIDVYPEIKDKIFVIPPGVNTNIFYPDDTDEYKFSKLPIIVSSRLDPKKNIEFVIESFNKYLKDGFELIIVLRKKPEEYTGYERQLIEKAKKAKGKFLVITSQKELAKLYNSAAKHRGIFALTSHYEPFGLAIIEAMACKLPVISTRNGGPVEILDNGKYGHLVSTHEEFKEAALKIKDNYEKLSEESYKRVMEKYTWERCAKEYLNLIEKENVILPEFFEKQMG
ncbi:hypothetical protein SU69_02730 [Thermosipho melanesiensis]|uniref:Probable sucrose-phosphate synthase n=1 Tax=Thermosipho melanesiensis (strain DSM 12029 / CIP 104789 / BI429) TaxID=391009 RepID=SPS_THEM4|nr:glycosyltransferase [Thermosipho melanesiensis]A6LKE9.1 RecName: Full=Probable sucrose-phosphate synthase; Short=psTm [Thermosipho melanesiensis BI429]AKM97307.1 sucrose phosphate synthase SPSTm [synthetic construct]ABR30400.1 Sucrose synthase [Thermosipho melanesiensis BI429]OOC37513.1 hypothetical protein SU68_02750 [Thermosipho melanesiensis]OOC39552.1 hypothetical protein SU69_02730 [Thermosipho melanesiensis]OOC39569.1 hypothetical protein SU70_02730 [Thermosipho melanesiensis]